MIPLRITLSGFMSYREQQTLTFDGARLWVLSGPNGAGKSAIFDAITFVLFGVFRDQRQKFTDLINHGCNKAVVVYDFSLGDTVYRVQRIVPKRGAATRCAYLLVTNPDGSGPKPEPIEITDTEKGFKDWVENKVGLNYETFTASVLLQQGKSDRLLDSDTDQRYKILSKLIDLSRYEELESRAKDRKRYWEGCVTYYNGQLANLSAVMDKDLVNAQQRINRAIEVSTAAQSQVDEFTELFGHAQRWEALHAQLTREKDELDEVRRLINKEKEIVLNYQRWVELTRVLPILNELVSSQNRLDQAKQAEIKHQEEYENALELFRLAEEREKSLGKRYQEQTAIAGSHQQETIDASNRLIELNPVVSLLDRIDDNKSKRELHLQSLSKFPPDLEQQLADALELESRFLEASRAVPWLDNLANNRKKLQDAVNKRDEATKFLDQAYPDLIDARQIQQRLENDYDQAHQVESNANSALAKAQARLEEIQAKADRFGEVEGEKICRYCGNEMSSEHVKRERKIIQTELAQAKQNLDTAQGEQHSARQHTKKTESASKKATKKLTEYESQIQSQELVRNTAVQDINKYLQSLSVAYGNLPSRFQSLVTSSSDRNESVWLAASFPKSKDINKARKEGDGESRQHAIVEGLRKLIAEHDKVLTLLTEAEKSIKQDSEQLPVSWETIRSECDTLQLQKEQADLNLRIVQAELTRIEQEIIAARNEVSHLQKIKTNADSALSGDRAKQSEILTTQQNFNKQLTVEWQSTVTSLKSKDLDKYQSECNSLVRYEELHQDLKVAKQTVKAKTKGVDKLEEQIANIPETARCKANEIRQKLTESQSESQRAANEKIQSEQNLRMLVERKDNRETVEAKKRKAERKIHLYGILAEQMGDHGIQQALINLAEVEIVNEANQSLYNLSSGRWTLSLRERGRNKKALDMEVRDTMTGGQDAIPVLLASGSQRFRIAISLALAIGKYIRRESRRIESVIIDEGFGSLDKTGREDTIQELRALQQHLERIILVSHQEEFYRTFQTGYTIDIVDGASRVTLLNN